MKCLSNSPRSLVTIALFVMVSCADDATTPPVNDSGRILRVRPDGHGVYASIQDAIDAAAPKDTIELADGIFRGDGNRDLNIGRRPVIIRSASRDPGYCVIDCDGSIDEPHTALLFNSQQSGSSVEGITITGGYGLDGVVVCTDGADPIFKNVVFFSNRSTAVVCRNSGPMFENCIFRSNAGGALACRFESQVTAVDCLFEDNFNPGSGGAVNVESSSLRLIGCSLSANVAGFSGGALRVGRSSDGVRPSIEVLNTIFAGNSAAYHGGAVQCSESDFLIKDCRLVRNTAGIIGGAFWCYFGSIGSVTSSLFFANQGEKGSAVACDGSTPGFQQCLMVFNVGSSAVFCDSLYGPAEVSLSCSDIFGNEGGDWIGCIATQGDDPDNISADPLFCNAETDDFRLQPDSPCAPSAVCDIMGPSPVGCSSFTESILLPEVWSQSSE